MQQVMNADFSLVWQMMGDDIKRHSHEDWEWVDYWESNRPPDHSVKDFYETYVWAVYNAGMAVKSLNAMWGRIEGALCRFQVKKIAANLEAVRQELLQVNRHAQKCEAVLDAALLLNNDPKIWRRLQPLTTAEAVNTMRKTFKYLGPQNTYHIVRNLGWDSPTHSGFTRDLAGQLGTAPDSLILKLSQAATYRVNTVDTLLGIWSRLSIHESDQEAIDKFRAALGLSLKEELDQHVL